MAGPWQYDQAGVTYDQAGGLQYDDGFSVGPCNPWQYDQAGITYDQAGLQYDCGLSPPPVTGPPPGDEWAPPARSLERAPSPRSLEKAPPAPDG
jgi:hypothetical protein